MSDFSVSNYGLTPLLAPTIVRKRNVNFTSGEKIIANNEQKKKSNHTVLKAIILGAAAVGIYFTFRGKMKNLMSKIKKFLNPEQPPKTGTTSPKPAPEVKTGQTGRKKTRGSKRSSSNNSTSQTASSTGAAKPSKAKTPQNASSTADVKKTEPKSAQSATEPLKSEKEQTYPQSVDKFEQELAEKRKAEEIDAAWREHDGTTQMNKEISQFLGKDKKTNNFDLTLTPQTNVNTPVQTPKNTTVTEPLKQKTKTKAPEPVNTNQREINVIEEQLKEIEQIINSYTYPGMNKNNKMLLSYKQERDALLSELQELKSAKP